MIYDTPDTGDPIRQADIFVGLPRLEVSLDNILLYEGGNVRETNWESIADPARGCSIVAGVRSVTGIVASQDCDLLRARDVILCEIRPFREVEKKCKDTTAPKSWKNIITQQARINLKWFYLPPEEGLNFREKMAVDFQTVIRVSRLAVRG